MSDQDFNLDPSKFPKRLELSLPPEIESKLEERVARTGRSIDEIILEILSRAMQADRDPED